MKIIHTKNFEQTQKVGTEFATEILNKKDVKIAVVLGLQGDLGAGKTTFLQGFAKGLGVSDVVNSPTFVIMKKFEIPNQSFKFFYHFDCYRLESPDDILQLGFKEIISNPQNIVAIEWPEKISALLPKNSIHILFTHVSPTQRSLEINM